MKRSTLGCLVLLMFFGCENKPPTDPVLRLTGHRGAIPSTHKTRETVKSRTDEAIRRTEKVLPEELSPYAREAVLKLVEALVANDISTSREQYAIVRSFEAAEYVVPGLLVTLEDTETRSTALSFLAAVGHDAEPAVPALIDLYLSVNSDGASHVLYALQWIGPASVTALDSLLGSEIGSIRAKGARGIKQIAKNVAGQSNLAGRHSEAERTLLILLEAEQLDPDTRLRADTIIFLAVVYLNQGRYDEVESRCAEARKLVETLGPKSFHLTATIFNCWGILHTRLGNYVKAEDLLKHAVENWEKAYHKETHIAVALNNLGTLYRYQGRFSEAQTAMERALEIWQFDFGFGPVWTPRALANLGALSLAQQEYDEAEQFLNESLMLSEARFGKEHPDVASTLTHQAKLADKQDKLAELEQAALRALEIRLMFYGPKHPDVARSQVLLAVAYARQGRPAPAVQLLQEGRAVLEQTVGLELVQDAELLQRAEELLESNPSEISSDRP